MAATSTPYGLRYWGKINGKDTGGTYREVPFTTNSATGVFTGDIVNMASGVVTPITATPTTSLGANTPWGVVVGVRYTDPVLKQTQFSSYLPGGAITAGYTNVFIRVIDDPDAVWQVQADGAVAATKIGLNAPLTNFSAGSTTSGNSAVKLASASIAATNTLGVKIIDLVNESSIAGGNQSQPGDAFTDCLVIWNQNVHAYRNILGQ